MMKRLTSKFMAVFTAITLPLVSIWAATQGPRLIEHASPSYTILSVDQVVSEPAGYGLYGVLIRKNNTCVADGTLLYVAGRDRDGARDAEVLMGAERDAGGTPYIMRPVIDTGMTYLIKELHFLAPQRMKDTLADVRLMIPCTRPVLGAVDRKSVV